MTGPVQSVQDTVRGMRPSTRARLLALLAVVTPAGLVLVNIAAYVMANLAAFRLAITISAVVSTIVLNGITAIAAYRTLGARFASSRFADHRAMGWIFQPHHARSNAVCGAFLLVVAAAISGELTYKGLSDPRKIPNLQTFLAGLLGLAVPLVLAALFRDEVTPRMRRRYRTRS